MREELLDVSLSPYSTKQKPGEFQNVNRRKFLQAMGVVGVGLALSPMGASAKAVNAGVWRDRVTGFVYTVCSERRAEAINSRLFSATLEYAPPPRSFHSFFGAPFVFVNTAIPPEEVICGNGFQVMQFPLYDVECPCGGLSDLNSHEIRRITNSKEMAYYKCVLAPVSQRRRPDAADHADYQQTLRYYPYSPNEVSLEYVRDFAGHGNQYPGYYVTHNTQKGPDGKPMGDILMGTDRS